MSSDDDLSDVAGDDRRATRSKTAAFRANQTQMTYQSVYYPSYQLGSSDANLYPSEERLSSIASTLKPLLFDISFQAHLYVALAIRLLLLLYGLLHDQIFELKYTDVDYSVFTGGSRFVAEGRSPFLRHGYRYTPLFAYITYADLLTGLPLVGKLIYAALDVAVGWLIYRILNEPKVAAPEPRARLAAFAWLYNPLPLVICTRGSSDSLICFLVLACVWLLIRRKILLAGLVFGLVVHCKLYPVIYAPMLYLFLSGRHTRRLLDARAVLPLNWPKLCFLLSSLASFGGITYACYQRYGQLYLDEAWLYHFRRQDLAHNFSPYFYLYRLSSSELYQQALGYLAFVPQLLCIYWLSVQHTVYANERLQAAWAANGGSRNRKGGENGSNKPDPRWPQVFYGLFQMTFLFVSLNKVCTSQYFLWYLALLPLASPYLQVDASAAVRLLNHWIVGQGAWLLTAYAYEFLRMNVLFWVWVCSMAFLCINLKIAYTLHLSFKQQAEQCVRGKHFSGKRLAKD